ncbi:MAG: transposase-like protein [Gammaproteobacteria bacterium]|jgi:transposase-like protein
MSCHFARKLRRKQGMLAEHWLLDQVFVNIQGQRHYLCRAIDQNGDVIRAELSHQPTPVRERGMRRFKSRSAAQRFLDVHAAVPNLFNLGRHLSAARHYRELRQRAFAS